MAKPLSQQEIDALLDTSDEEAIEESDQPSPPDAPSGERVEPYNFKRPRLFSQDQMRVLNYVHESFARDLSVYLSAQLRTIVEIELTSVDQVIYSEFVMSSAPPSALYVVSVTNLDQKIVFEIDPRLVIYTVEKLFGGPGQFISERREVSAIERRIMSKVMNRTFEELEGAWSQAHEINLEEEAFETNAEFVQIIPVAEPAFVATFKIIIHDEPSFINICYPYILLENMLDSSDGHQWIASVEKEASPEERERFEERLQATNVVLTAELGRTQLPALELMRLEQGDVIPLDRGVDDALPVYVNDHHKYTAAAGTSGDHRAIKILEIDESEPEL